MSPDDPRHGSLAGYRVHRDANEDACDACRAGAATYQAERDRDRILGRARRYPARGFARRLDALMAIGWSAHTIADALEIDVRNLLKVRRHEWVTPARHHRMVELYDRWSMTPPTDRYANRRRILAARKGFVPPLAWDDIDTDRRPAPAYPKAVKGIDEIAVQRAFNGDTTVQLYREDRVELARRWHAAGRVLSDLERMFGINPQRALERAG